jgi:hypothetical protein
MTVLIYVDTSKQVGDPDHLMGTSNNDDFVVGSPAAVA